MSTQDKKFVLLTGELSSLEQDMPPFSIFEEQVLQFLNALSIRLRRTPEAHPFPDLSAFAFWCRENHLRQLMEKWDTESLCFGRGLAFHVCPGNVPLNFAYSLASGLLAGCACAVRLSSRDFPQARLLCREMDALLHAEFRGLLSYITCFQCEHGHPVLARLSERCGVRILWGGDEAIRQIRQLPLSPRAVELSFASRYSVCVIDAESFLSDPNPEQLSERFYVDAYFAGQWACTSPRALLWLGEDAQVEAAQKFLWQRVERLCQNRADFLPIHAVKKREHFCLMAAQNPEVRLCAQSNHAVRVLTPRLTPELLELWTGDGLFLETHAQTLDALLPILGERCQTLCCYGIETAELQEFLRRARPAGIDRVVPLGSSMQFSLVWDGIDLIHAMSRSVEFS